MMNAERGPLKMTLFNNEPLSTRVIIESRIKPQETKSAFDPKNTGARKATTAIRAVQGTKGAIKIVKKRAGFESITRVPKMDGTLQPKPRNNGRKDLPCNPIMCMKLSMTKAARAMYPMSS